MHDRGFGDAGLVHGFQQRLVGRRPLARPRRLLAAERSKRIAFGVRRNDMGMNIDNWRHGTSRDERTSLRAEIDKDPFSASYPHVLYEVHSAFSQLAYVGCGVRRRHGAKPAAP